MSDASSHPTRTPSGAELAARAPDLPLPSAAFVALAQRLDALPLVDEVAALPIAELVERLADLWQWLFSSTRTTSTESSATVRLRALLRSLAEDVSWRARLSAMLGRLMREVDFAEMFEIGLPNDRGLYEETMDRLARGLLPRPRDPRNARELIANLFSDQARADWFASLPEDLVVALCDIIGDGKTAFQPLRQSFEEGIALLATRTSAIGLGSEIRERSPACALAASPFFLLPRLCDALFSGMGSTAACFEQIAAARTALQAVLVHLDRYGVSIDVVYRIEVIERNLDRLAELLMIVDAPTRAVAQHTAVALVGRFAAALVRDRSLRDVVRTNGRLLARKIVERAGSSGEHYITSSRREWRQMIFAAAGGGLLTVGTTALKYIILGMHLPLFGEGLFASINYAGSFLLMQLFGFALATKQPSMVAASLAGSLKSARADVDLTELVDLFARIVRSQFAAALGNVVVGFAAAIAFEAGWSFLFGAPFLTSDKAAHTLHSLDPFGSGTILFATITGVFLWLSSLGAGWLENFVIYRRIPAGIAQHPIGRIVGRARMVRLAAHLQHGIAAIGGNITIGVLLGMMPVIGSFFGVPLEVRHVTLSTCSVALAIASQGLLGLANHGVPRAALGIFIILLLNFGVSFSLALWIAMRARGVRNQGLRIARALWKRFYLQPLDFLRPPPDPK